MAKRTDNSRTAILAAAHAAFRQPGFAATTMDDIARTAGLTRKTLYNLFGSKQEIARQLIAMAEADDGAYRARMAANEPAMALLEMVLLDSASWCLANPDLARMALDPAERPTITPPPGRPSFQRLVGGILQLGQQQGTIRDDEDPGLLALLLLAMFGQAMLTNLASGAVDRRQIRQIIRLLHQGIGA